MPPPKDPNAPTCRVTVDLSEDEGLFVDQLAAYRNALAFEQNGKELKVKWKRKLMTEDLVTNQIVQQRIDLALLFKAVGPFPSDPEDEVVMREYAKRANAWLSKRAK